MRPPTACAQQRTDHKLSARELPGSQAVATTADL
jgi:hypothetical protein